MHIAIAHPLAHDHVVGGNADIRKVKGAQIAKGAQQVNQTDQKARRVALKKYVRRDRRRLAAVLRAAIQDADIKQSVIAKRLGIRPNMLSEIVTARRKTELGEIVAIAEIIHTDPLALIRRALNW